MAAKFSRTRVSFVLGREKVPRGALTALRGTQWTEYIESGFYNPVVSNSQIATNLFLDWMMNVPDLRYITQTGIITSDLSSVYEVLQKDRLFIQNMSAAPIKLEIIKFRVSDFTTATPAVMQSNYENSSTWGIDKALATSIVPGPTTTNVEIWRWPQINPFENAYFWRLYGAKPRRIRTVVIKPFSVFTLKGFSKALFARETLKYINANATGMLPFLSERLFLRFSGKLASGLLTFEDATTNHLGLDFAPASAQLRWLTKFQFRRVQQDVPTIYGNPAPFNSASTHYAVPAAGPPMFTRGQSQLQLIGNGQPTGGAGNSGFLYNYQPIVQGSLGMYD